ncbi:MAG: HDIG domain-containing protein [Eubacteriaceae bacterium]|nr:HDIG domain-containing protein [Eubacteriaceae bacterium]
MVKRKHNQEFETIVGDILTHSEFQKLKLIEHHGNGLYEHSVAVGYHSYRVARVLGLDYVSVARGALLHDFFVESWRGKKKNSKGIQRIKDMHGFSHPKTALVNAQKYFDIDELQADMIIKHMFPLTPVPPMHLGSWIVTAVDKFVAAREMIFEKSHPIEALKGILLKA